MHQNGVTVIRRADLDRVDDSAKLLQALAAEPPAVVYDLTGVTDSDPTLSVTFDTVDLYLSGWSGTPLLIVTAGPVLRSALRSHPLGGRTTCWPTLDAALAAGQRQPPADRSTLDLDPEPTAPRQARDLIRRTLLRWDLTPLYDAAALVTTELVTNAVTHASTPLTISISRPHSTGNRTRPAARLAVRDLNNELPVLIWTAPPLPGGRGIWLVDSIARAWGTIPLDPGKTVWAVLDGRTIRTR